MCKNSGQVLKHSKIGRNKEELLTPPHTRDINENLSTSAIHLQAKKNINAGLFIKRKKNLRKIKKSIAI